MKSRYLTTSTEVLFGASLLASVCPHDLLAQAGSGGNWQEFAVVWPTTEGRLRPVYGF